MNRRVYRLEAIAEFQADGLRLDNELPIAVAIPVLEDACVVAPVTAWEAAARAFLIRKIADVERSAPVLSHKGRAHVHQGESVERLVQHVTLINKVLRLTLVVRIESSNQVHA